MASTFQLKDSKGNTFSAAIVGPICRLGDGRTLEYVDAEDTFRIKDTGEVLMRPLPVVASSPSSRVESNGQPVAITNSIHRTV